MLGEGNKERVVSVPPRKTFFRSVSWNERSPSERENPRPPPPSNKARGCLPPLQPLSISRRNAEEWPRAGSDDLGVWPNPQTPRGPLVDVKSLDGTKVEDPQLQFQFRRDKLAFFDKECSRIDDHIYLGSDAVAKNRELLKQKGITHVLNCVGFVSPEYFKSDLVYKTLWLQDSPSEDITSILYDVFDYFEDVREHGGRVLVHCCQGVSRSTSLVIAYLMWRDGQSFEDAFQYVKAARGVTNPNMGFACQLLQLKKRVHPVPASTSPILRMYRMAPHSPYDPLHLVPKMSRRPGPEGLDSRGAFVVHVPSAIYIWIGKNCKTVMLNRAKDAALQVIRYERAKGPIVNIKEGEEPLEFWDAFANKHLLSDEYDWEEEKDQESLSEKSNVSATNCVVGQRRVHDYDLDFEIFHKALAGGVVPPFSVSNADSETCLPARENGWGRLRQKFASGEMKDYVTSSKWKKDSLLSTDVATANPDPEEESDCLEPRHAPPSPSTPSTYSCGSPDSFSSFLKSGTERKGDIYNDAEESVNWADPFSSPVHTPPCNTPNSLSSAQINSPISGEMKDYVTSSKWKKDFHLSTDVATANPDPEEESDRLESRHAPPSPSTPSTYSCGSPDSFSRFLKSGAKRKGDTYNDAEESVNWADPFSSPVHTPPCNSPDSLSSAQINSPIFSSKSPTLSPSTSDYASSFTFSPSSTNWSDLPYISSQQTSPSGIELTDPFLPKNVPLLDISSLHKGTPALPSKTLFDNQGSEEANPSFPYKGILPSIAERRGSTPPPPMKLPSVDEPSHVHKNLVRSWSFSLSKPDDDDVMKDIDCDQSEEEGSEGYEEVVMLDANNNLSENKLQNEDEAGKYDHFTSRYAICETVEVRNADVYQWPSMTKVEMPNGFVFDSYSVYILVVTSGKLEGNIPVALFVWLGREASVEQTQDHPMRSDHSCQVNLAHWEAVGHGFLKQKGFPVDIPVQIIRQGEEPEQFFQHLSLCMEDSPPK